MPIGKVNIDAKLVGYFFKLQGYVPLERQARYERLGKAAILKAPLIIGRLIRTGPPPTADGPYSPAPVWLLVSIGLVGVALIVGWVFLSMRKTGRRSLPAIVPGPSHDPDAPAVDNWLDQAQSGRLTWEAAGPTTRGDGASTDALIVERGLADRFGNNFGANSDSNNGQGGFGPEVHDNGDSGGRSATPGKLGKTKRRQRNKLQTPPPGLPRRSDDWQLITRPRNPSSFSAAASRP